MKGRVTLMHKNNKVASCYFGKGQTLTQIYSVYDEKLLPVVAQKDTLLNLQKWINGRFTAKSRSDFSAYRDFYSFDAKNLSSVMDGYWIKEEKSDSWDEVNPFKSFENITDEIENIVFSPDKVKNAVLNWDSPNLTIPFETESYVLKENGKFYLLQGAPKRQMDQYKRAVEHDIPLAPREYVLYKEQLFTKVELSISEEVEYIPFEEYFLAYEKQKDIGHFANILGCCEFYKIPGYKTFLENVAHFTEVTGNRDWKLSDIGVLRNSDTLEILGFHPLI